MERLCILALVRQPGGWVLLLALALQGCAYSWVAADGSRHLLGLVHLTQPPVGLTAGEALRSQSIGLSLSSSEAGSALVLGYSDTTMAYVRNNSLVTADLLLRPSRLLVPNCPKE